MRCIAGLLFAIIFVGLSPVRAHAEIDWGYWQREVAALGCEGAMDVAMARLKAAWAVKLIASHFGCEAAVEHVLGKAEAQNPTLPNSIILPRLSTGEKKWGDTCFSRFGCGYGSGLACVAGPGSSDLGTCRFSEDAGRRGTGQ
jgi:hypothetical protein